METSASVLPGELLDVLRQGTLTEEQARRIYQQGCEAVTFALLVQAKRIAEQQAQAAAEIAPDARHALGHEAALCEAAGQVPQEASRGQGGPCRHAPPAA